MSPIILFIVHLIDALRFMRHGYWGTVVTGGYAVTPAHPKPGPVVLIVPFHQMLTDIHHGYECTRQSVNHWLCTPNQIPKSARR